MKSNEMRTRAVTDEELKQFREYMRLVGEFMRAAGLTKIEDPQIIPYEIQELNPFKER